MTHFWLKWRLGCLPTSCSFSDLLEKLYPKDRFGFCFLPKLFCRRHTWLSLGGFESFPGSSENPGHIPQIRRKRDQTWLSPIAWNLSCLCCPGWFVFWQSRMNSITAEVQHSPDCSRCCLSWAILTLQKYPIAENPTRSCRTKRCGRPSCSGS